MAKKRKGIFITFEGLDGSGKTTQIKYLKKLLESMEIPVIVSREPGGTYLGERIRKLVLSAKNGNVADRAELFLYAAARAQHIAEILKPAVEAGKVVICDRFIDSSIAYQGYGRNMLREVMEANEAMLREMTPDITFLLRMKPGKALKRIDMRANDRMEQQSRRFHEKVYHGYEKIRKNNPERVVALEATMTKKELKEKIHLCVKELLHSRGLYDI